MRHRITIQRPAITEDNIGNQITTWSDVATVWAKAESLSGREYWAAAQTQSEKSVRFTIRFRADIKTEMRVAYGTRILNIQSAIDPEERKRHLVLTCIEPGER